MNLPLVFETGVRGDIDGAYSWYEQQRRGPGEKFLKEVEAVLDRIEEHPERYATIYKNVRHTRVKRFPYAVYYKIEPARIAVIAVHHSKRDSSHWQSRA